MFDWWQNSSRSVYFASQGKTGVYSLSLSVVSLNVWLALTKSFPLPDMPAEFLKVKGSDIHDKLQ